MPRIKIGADPEFVLVKETFLKETIPATRYFRKGGTRGGLGTDGASNTGELRPSPGSPTEVAWYIGYLLEQAVKQLPEDIQIRAGGGKFFHTYLGGHIHFQAVSNTNMILALDHFIGEPLKRKKGGARPGTSYGWPRDYRRQSYKKGKSGFEYRVPPSWITHPKLTYATLYLAREIVEHYVDNPTDVVPVTTPTREEYLAIMKRKPRMMTKEELVDAFLKFPSLDMGDVLVNWGLREKKIKILFSSNDSFLPFAYPDEFKTSIPNTLLVYGLRSSRGDRLIRVSGLTLSRKVTKYLRDNEITYQYESTRGNAIGFSRDLREAYKAEKIFKEILRLTE